VARLIEGLDPWPKTTARLRDFLGREKYFVFVARDDRGNAVGFVSLCESHALYAEGSFGTIPELYVRPARRSKNVGRSLVSAAKGFGLSRGWKRLEVTTPPLPQFDKTLAFYEREGFAITGGRKLKVAL
jgi:GNAT superfamily N-acetyltransferase